MTSSLWGLLGIPWSFPWLPEGAMTLSAGARLGPYEIVSLIGVGGMGEVYTARDTRLDRTVAVKVLLKDFVDRSDRRRRFETEARAISSLHHPHICTLFDVGEQDGLAFLVMEYLEGETLDDRLTRGPLPVKEMLANALQIADALDHAHREHFVHRDLKPGNVILTSSGAKLLDFGLVRRTAGEPVGPVSSSTLSLDQRKLTAEGALLGTCQYMAPEQLEGKEADARTDIFALGTLMFEMATGQKAFEGSSQASLIASILTHHPPPASSVQTRQQTAAGARSHHRALPGKEPCRSVADGARRQAGAGVDRWCRDAGARVRRHGCAGASAKRSPGAWPSLPVGVVAVTAMRLTRWRGASGGGYTLRHHSAAGNAD